VFGQVPFASLFGQQEKMYIYATGAFRYVIDRYSPGDVALQGTVIQVGIDNPCRSVHIDFLPGLGPTDAGDISNIQADASLVQESADFVATSVFGGVVGTLDAQIVPGQGWSMSVSQSRGHLLTWYANGTASCYKAATDNNA
jgi:hypothetical protein